MEKLHARIHSTLGRARHVVATDGEMVPCGVPVLLTILAEDDGYYLLRNDAEGRCISDTWHLTLEEAKEQAEFEFGVRDGDWRIESNGGADVPRIK